MKVQVVLADDHQMVREGLRLLEENEHRRLLEKWLYEDLSAQELEQLPIEIKDRAQAYFRNLVKEALEDINAGRVVDGPTAMRRLREELEAHAK